MGVIYLALITVAIPAQATWVNPFTLQLREPFSAGVCAGFHHILLSVPPFPRLLFLFTAFVVIAHIYNKNEEGCQANSTANSQGGWLGWAPDNPLPLSIG
jgi:hypothetical protein